MGPSGAAHSLVDCKLAEAAQSAADASARLIEIPWGLKHRVVQAGNHLQSQREHQREQVEHRDAEERNQRPCRCLVQHGALQSVLMDQRRKREAADQGADCATDVREDRRRVVSLRHAGFDVLMFEAQLQPQQVSAYLGRRKRNGDHRRPTDWTHGFRTGRAGEQRNHAAHRADAPARIVGITIGDLHDLSDDSPDCRARKRAEQRD